MLPNSRPSLRNVYLIVAFCSAIELLYAIARRSPPYSITLFDTAAPIIVIGLWIRQCARQSGVALPFDFGYLFLIGWPFVVVLFAKRLSPLRPWRFVAMLFALAAASAIPATAAEIATVSSQF